MDILNPQLLWLGKRCYRINNHIDTNEQQRQKPATTSAYVEDGEFVGLMCTFRKRTKLFRILNDKLIEFFPTDLYADNDEDDVNCQEEYEVIEIAPNRYKSTFHVPQ